MVLTGGFFGRISANNFQAEPDAMIILGASMTGSIGFNVSGSYSISFMGYRKAGGIGWYPSWGKWEIPPKWWPWIKVK